MKNIISFVLSGLLVACSFASLSAYDWKKHIPFEPESEEVKSSETYYGPVAKAGYRGENLTVYGPLALTDSTIQGSLTVYGPCMLENTTVKGSVILFGVISAKNSSFRDLQATAAGVELIDSTVQDIVMLKNGNHSQELSLVGKTKVTGVITFEQDNGIVRVSPEASYPEVINGGKIVKE